MARAKKAHIKKPRARKGRTPKHLKKLSSIKSKIGPKPSRKKGTGKAAPSSRSMGKVTVTVNGRTVHRS